MERTGRTTRELEPLLQRLEEFRAAKRRLAELSSAYAAIEDSKFARLRRAFLDIEALVRGSSQALPPGLLTRRTIDEARGRNNPNSPTGGRKPPAEAIVALETQVLELTELLEAERSGTGGDPYERWRG